MKTSFVWSKYWANIFVTLSCPFSLAFNYKCSFLLLILIYDKIRLSLAALCPSGPRPCLNCRNNPSPEKNSKALGLAPQWPTPHGFLHSLFSQHTTLSRWRPSQQVQILRVQFLVSWFHLPSCDLIKAARSFYQR